MMVTSFTRIVIVFSLLRQALGLQQTPPNAVLISLSLFLTLIIMQPTFDAAWTAGVQPVIDEKMDSMQGFKLASEPFAKFMIAHTFEDDLKLFADANAPNAATAAEKKDHPPLQVLIPAFMISELKRAFEIGFLIFIPFLIIDMVVASILMSMGMMMLPPVTISIPFKLIFFVLIDGWKLISSSLIQSYAVK
jgi:flagellar biosynthetic protein FliP